MIRLWGSSYNIKFSLGVIIARGTIAVETSATVGAWAAIEASTMSEYLVKGKDTIWRTF